MCDKRVFEHIKSTASNINNNNDDDDGDNHKNTKYTHTDTHAQHNNRSNLLNTTAADLRKKERHTHKKS